MLRNVGKDCVIISLWYMLTNALFPYNRSHPTLARHLWVISKLLTMKEPGINPRKSEIPLSRSESIRFYVAATCYPKILRRLKNTVSQRYIKSLEAVTTFPFDESMCFQPTKDQPTKDQIQNDRQFALVYLLPVNAQYKNGHLANTFPHLIEQANTAKDDPNFQLYTEETCMEFHKFLLEILTRFRIALDSLHSTRGSNNAPTEGSAEFKHNATAVMVIAYPLQRLATGAAIRMHLRVIETFLKDWNLSPVSTPTSDEEEEELDVDLKAVRPSSNKDIPLWTSYADWLRLMVSHFDAIEILLNFTTGSHFHHEAISIQIVVPPQMDQQLLKWQELFTKPTLFPVYSTPLATLNSKSNALISNTSILEFLSKALETTSKAKEANEIWKTAKGHGKDHNSVKAVIELFEKMEFSNLPGWVECAEEILVDLKNYQPSHDLTRKITENIKFLVESAKFYTHLDEKLFKGTLHCEACLASFLAKPIVPLSTTAVEDVSARMLVGDISYLFLSPESHFL